MIDLAGTRRRLFAASYTRIDGRLRRATDLARSHLVGDLTGEILEVGAGTGLNFAYYAAEARVVATDLNEHMLVRARPEAKRAAATIELQLADAMALPFTDGRFDAVVATLVMCSVPDQQTALSEIRRVLKPGGVLRILEHVRSDKRSVATIQHIVSPAWSVICDGCHLDRDTVAAVHAAGFEIEAVEGGGVQLPMKHVVLFARRPT